MSVKPEVLLEIDKEVLAAAQVSEHRQMHCCYLWNDMSQAESMFMSLRNIINRTEILARAEALLIAAISEHGSRHSKCFFSHPSIHPSVITIALATPFIHAVS